MPRREKKYHYLYKTTNLINGKFYVGMHSTNDLEDGYLGSGKRLKYSINKYGRDNFKIEYLEFFEDRKTLVEREKNLVNEELIKEPLCMNLKPGGFGGLVNEEHGLKLSKAGIESRKILYDTDPEYKKMLSEFRRKQNLKLWKSGFYDNTEFKRFEGKTHSEESKSKMRDKASLRIGNKNSQFGTCWIYKNEENKKIKTNELDKWLSLGWFKGRKIN
jgi:hypothetical protein